MDDITAMFKRYPSQKAVVKKLLEYGISVYGGKAFCGDIEIADSSLARACDVDRRVVRTTLEHISSDEDLSRVFSKLFPVLSLMDLANEIGCSSFVITPTDARIPGILADIMTLLYNSGVTVRQVMIQDGTDRDKSTLQIVVDGKMQDSSIMMLRSCRGVASVLVK